jgi:hypothetical protein
MAGQLLPVQLSGRDVAARGRVGDLLWGRVGNMMGLVGRAGQGIFRRSWACDLALAFNRQVRGS